MSAPIETLTDAERADLESIARAVEDDGPGIGAAKALRIIDGLIEALATERRRAEEALAAAEQKLEVLQRARSIIDAQALRIDRARKLASDPQPVGSREARLAADMWRVLGG